MWNWLLSWFGKGTRYDVYSVRERKIYRYWKGKAKGFVDADPMTIYRRIMDVRPELIIDLKVADSPMKNAADAGQKAVDKLKKIFDVEDYEHGGLTEIELRLLLEHFLAYCDVVKKNSATSPISPEPETSGLILDDAPATSSTSESGSTSAASGITGPAVPPSESA